MNSIFVRKESSSMCFGRDIEKKTIGIPAMFRARPLYYKAKNKLKRGGVIMGQPISLLRCQATGVKEERIRHDKKRDWAERGVSNNYRSRRGGLMLSMDDIKERGAAVFRSEYCPGKCDWEGLFRDWEFPAG
ncbi:hypothetical protein CDAR_518231 [Caerostris darwini]|uniref:Uncharacterized protein n=1 Tax=Caerostris darwini TaxID=1538125 RepID=A0AAV4RNS4_9ARAC|nr:hypothetical protein CDAR_518231 [Caerostris darwini]